MGSLIGGIVGSLIDGAVKLFTYFGFYFWAKNKAKAEDLQAVVDAQKKQLEIANRPTLSRDELLARMRSRIS